MKLITRFIEDAAGGAVCAGDVASVAAPLMASTFKRAVPPTEPVKVIKIGKKAPKQKKRKGLRETFYAALGEEAPAQTDEVVAKLKSLENRESVDNRDTVTFGLEDDGGKIVRVTVRADQAENFERALQSAMSDDPTQPRVEIAELLFDLKDEYDIVDVDWPEIEEDEEESQQLKQPAADSAEVPPDADSMGDSEPDIPDVGADSTEASTKDLLTQVIDMMRADADARKADARAREAEAREREAEAASRQAMARVKQEEQLLDMETYNKAKKEEDREAKRLAQLAKWKHDVDAEHGITDEPDFSSMPTTMSGEENEERTRKSTVTKRVHPHDIANFILKRVK